MTRDREIQIEDDDYDAGILFTDRPRPGFDMRRLFGDEVIAVCCPDYLEERPHIRGAKDLAKEHLLHLVTDDPWMGWPEWFETSGIHIDASLTGSRFTNYILVIQAALEGQGIALGWRRLINPMLERGELVRVTAHVAVPEVSYCESTFNASSTIRATLT